jgi:hypothetical protein
MIAQRSGQGADHCAAGEGGERPDRHRARPALLFAYLFLVALYESWNIPPPVLLSITIAALGANRRGGAVRSCLR